MQLSDPELFLAFFDLRRADGKSRGYRFEYKYFTHEYRWLLQIGDTELNYASSAILFELFGDTNRMLVRALQDDWISNDNWSKLALVYGLHNYVAWIPDAWSVLFHREETHPTPAKQKNYKSTLSHQ